MAIKVVIYTRAVDGSGDFEAARKAIPLLLQDKRIQIQWIVESQQEQIKNKIKDLKTKEVFPGVDIINVDPNKSTQYELYNKCPVDTDLVIILPQVSEIRDRRLEFQERCPNARILVLAEYDATTMGASGQMGLAKRSQGVLMPESVTEEQLVAEEQLPTELSTFQINKPFFFGYHNTKSHATTPASTKVVESFVKSAIIIANKEGHDPIQLVANIPQSVLSTLKLDDFLKAHGIQKQLKIFNPFPVDSKIFQTLLQKSHPITLGTGDQSLIENIFSSKCVFYQVMIWKGPLAKAFKQIALDNCGSDSYYYRFVSAAIDNPESLPELLQQEWNEEVRSKIQEDANKIALWIRQNKNLNEEFPKLVHSYVSVIENRFETLAENIDSINSLSCILSDCSGKRTQICEAMKSKLPSIIKTEEDFNDILSILMQRENVIIPVDAIVILFESMKDKLPDIIKSGGQLKLLFENIHSREDRDAILNALGEQLGTLFKNCNQFEDLFSSSGLPGNKNQLSKDQVNAILDVLERQGKLSVWLQEPSFSYEAVSTLEVIGHNSVTVAARCRRMKAQEQAQQQQLADFGSLCLAAENGDLETVKSLLHDKKVNINQQSSNGATPLFIAAQNGQIRVLDELLNNNADYNKPGPEGKTALYIAALNGHAHVVKSLLRRGAYLNHEADAATLLLAAAKNGHSGVVKELLDFNLVHPNDSGPEDATALFIAAENGHIKTVEILLRHYLSNPNLKRLDGETALLIAVRNGHQEVVEALLRHTRMPVKPNEPGSNGATPLSIAVQKGNLAMVQALLRDSRVDPDKSCNGLRPLCSAVENGNVDIMNALLQHGANPKLPAPGGATLLCIATQNGHLNAVETLLPYMDPNQKGPDGATPLFIAAKNGNVAIVKALLADPRVNPRARHEPSGMMPFQAAQKYPEIQKLIRDTLSAKAIDRDENTSKNNISSVSIETTKKLKQQLNVERTPDEKLSHFPK